MKQPRLFYGNKLLLAAHIRSENNGNIHAAVSIEVVLKKCDKHSGRSNNSVVECVCKIVAVLALDTDLQAACLCISEI